MRVRIDRGRARRAVWALVTLYAALTVYAAVAGSDLAALATDLLFGLTAVGFGALLVVRTSTTHLLAAGSLLAVGGGLVLLDAVARVPGWLVDPPVVAGMGLYVRERWLRRGTDRADPLDPRHA